jgi:hypothetical protein
MYGKGTVSIKEVDELIRTVIGAFVNEADHPNLTRILKAGEPLPQAIQTVIADESALEELGRIQSGQKSGSEVPEGKSLTLVNCPHCDRLYSLPS